MLSIALGRTTRLMPIASSEQPSGEADQRIDTGDNMYACSVGKVGRMGWRWCVTRLSSRASWLKSPGDAEPVVNQYGTHTT